MRALVVFHGHGNHPLARFLKPGFRHCFIAVEADGQWVTLDGRAGLAVVEIAAPADYDLATFYRKEGFTVIETEQRGRVPFTPFVTYNCVGLVKAVLAIGAVLVVTPWQLYSHLARAESPGLQLLPGNSLFAPGKPGKMTVNVKGLKNMGRGGDTELAHVNPAEKRMLKKMGGSGTINPKTGLKEFKFGGGGHGASNESREANRGGGSQRDSGDLISGGGFDESIGDPTGGPAVDEFGREVGRGIDIDRRKSVVNVAPGDERGGQSQRDGSLILSIQLDGGGELGGGGGGTTTSKEAAKSEERKGGRAASLLSASEGIRDKLGRSGRRGPGKSLG